MSCPSLASLLPVECRSVGVESRGKTLADLREVIAGEECLGEPMRHSADFVQDGGKLAAGLDGVLACHQPDQRETVAANFSVVSGTYPPLVGRVT